MPKVPINENRVQVRTASAEPLKIASLGSGIVGNNVTEAAQGLTSTINKSGSLVAEQFQKQLEIDSQKKVMEMSNNAFGELDNLLYDTSADENGRPRGLLNRKLGQVGDDTVVEFDKGVGALIAKYSEGLDKDTAVKFQSSIGAHARTLRDNVAKHQVAEKRADFDNIFKANMDIRVGSAAKALSDDSLSTLIGDTHRELETALKTKGLDAQSIQIEKQKATDEMIKNNIFSKLESDPDQAKTTLANFKDSVSPEFYQKTMEAIDGKRFDNTRSSLYETTFSRMKLSTGEPDLARIEKTVRASKNWTEPQKEKLMDYFKSRGMEDYQNKNRYDRDVINKFSNEIIGLKKQGGTLDDAFKMVGKYGGDNVDIKEREDIARKLFTDPGARSNPDALIDLHEKILTGTASKADIKQAFADNKLNAADYVRLTNEHLSQKLGEVNKESSMADMAFKNKLNSSTSRLDKDKRNDAYIVYLEKTKGKTPEEKALIGEQLLKDVVTDVGTFFDTKKPAFEVEKQKMDANSAVWGSLYQDIGQKEVNAIGGGYVRKGAQSWGAGDVDKFAQQFGGMSAIKKGTPVNNAINSLVSKGKMVTVDNVKAVLAVHKDGKY